MPLLPSFTKIHQIAYDATKTKQAPPLREHGCVDQKNRPGKREGNTQAIPNEMKGWGGGRFGNPTVGLWAWFR